MKIIKTFESFINEGITEVFWKDLSDTQQHNAILAIRGKKEAQKYAGELWTNLPNFIVRDLAKITPKDIISKSVNEAISKSEESKIVKYLDGLKDETLFDFNNDAHGQSDDAETADQWNSNKNDLDHSDLVDFALDHVVNFSIKLKELKEVISSTYA